VYKDARRRIEDPVLVAVAVATALLFPFVGLLVYTILRPPEYLDDVRERDLEIRAMEHRLGGASACPTCRSPIEASFLSCPVCTTRLKSACRRCKSPLDPAWRICPYCETEPREAEPLDAPTIVSVPRQRRSRTQPG
jgi:RNA polymerase subunit RPABC4/transcription elongation factor Spt4